MRIEYIRNPCTHYLIRSLDDKKKNILTKKIDI